MLKKEVTYKNYNDEEVTEVLYFHLSDADIVRIDASFKGGLEAAVHKMVEDDDRAGIFQLFENVILTAFGIKTEDGSGFIRNDEVRETFSYTAAYESILNEMVTDDNSAVSFITQLLPQSRVKDVPVGGVNGPRKPERNTAGYPDRSSK